MTGGWFTVQSTLDPPSERVRSNRERRRRERETAKEGDGEQNRTGTEHRIVRWEIRPPVTRPSLDTRDPKTLFPQISRFRQ